MEFGLVISVVENIAPDDVPVDEISVNVELMLVDDTIVVTELFTPWPDDDVVVDGTLVLTELLAEDVNVGDMPVLVPVDCVAK